MESKSLLGIPGLLYLPNARTDAQRAQMQEIMEKGVCPFCPEHFAIYHTPPVLGGWEHWLVSKNEHPYEGSRVHLLLVTKRHVITFSELTVAEAGELPEVVKWAEALMNIPGGSFLMRFGDMRYNGATVAHLHAHIISGDMEEEGSERIRGKLGFCTKR